MCGREEKMKKNILLLQISLAVGVLAACSPADQESYVVNSRENNEEVTQVGEGNTGNIDNSSVDVLSTSLPQGIALNYEAVSEGTFSGNSVQSTDVSLINAGDVFVKRTIELDERDQFILYVKSEQDTALYVGLTGLKGLDDKSIYEIGPAGEVDNANDYVVEKADLFGQFHIKLIAVCGSDCMNQTYIAFNSGVPVVVYTVDGDVRSVDLDEDGINELVVTETSANAQTQIFKKFDEDIKVANLNGTFELEVPYAVSYSNYLFTIQLDGREAQYQYNYQEDILTKISDSSEAVAPLIVGGLYDGAEQIELSNDSENVTAAWHTNTLSDFGLYLTEEFESKKLEDGSEFVHSETGATISLLDMGVEDLSYFRKESYLSQYSDYIGTEFWGDNRDGRTVYFQYKYDDDHDIIVQLRYHVTGDGLAEADWLNAISTIKYKPAS